MSYLAEFQGLLEKQNLPKLLHLWEEYCAGDDVNSDEIKKILLDVKKSELTRPFGKYVELILPLWSKIEDKRDSNTIIRLIFDLQTTNSPILEETCLHYLKNNYGDHKLFNEKLRLIGLRNNKSFQGAIHNYELLSHMDNGKFVFHSGGWGAGEIMDISLIREQLVIEFENVLGRKDVPFENAFKTLSPLPNDHFLAQRFAFPDELEEKARKSPVEVIKMLLRDLGSKTAAEIKDEMSELVIPAKDWSKWWQSARAKIKKDTLIQTPATFRLPFVLRQAALSHEENFKISIESLNQVDKLIQVVYNFFRDFSVIQKNQELISWLKDKLQSILLDPETTESQKVQILIFFENTLELKEGNDTVAETIQKNQDIKSLIRNIPIVAYKKRALVAIRNNIEEWKSLFISLLFNVEESQLRDYLLKELKTEDLPQLEERIHQLMQMPMDHPDLFVWYFQKIVNKDTDLPFSDKQSKCTFLEYFLILFHFLELKPENRDLLKKMYSLLATKQFAVVRSIIEHSDFSFIQEFLLLVSKCHTIKDHDRKVLRSLAEVVHPSLAKKKGSKHSSIVWTSEEGLLKVQERIKHIGTIEIVEVAKEIEVARALGDLRENAEYKYALEKRSQLQEELSRLSKEINKARIITEEDIVEGVIGVGSIVDLIDENSEHITYSLLGPWDVDLEKGILSFQSKLANSMMGLAKGESFTFNDKTYEVLDVYSFLSVNSEK